MRYVVDAAVLLGIASGEYEVHAQHQLVGPSIVHSQAVSMLLDAVRTESLERRDAHERLEALAGIKMRLLNTASPGASRSTSPSSTAGISPTPRTSLSAGSRPTPS